MILEDFKNDNSYGHYANTLEMLLLCDIMMGTLDGSSPHSTIKSIQSSYQKYSSKIIPHIVSRVLFMASNIQSCRDLWKGDNRKSRPNFGLMMIKHSEKESIELNAMLLDQAARILKDYNDSSKAGFQYIMAGHMYNKMNLLAQSIRCYVIALYEYNCKGWNFIEVSLFCAEWIVLEPYQPYTPTACVNLCFSRAVFELL